MFGYAHIQIRITITPAARGCVSFFSHFILTIQTNLIEGVSKKDELFDLDKILPISVFLSLYTFQAHPFIDLPSHKWFDVFDKLLARLLLSTDL